MYTQDLVFAVITVLVVLLLMFVFLQYMDIKPNPTETALLVASPIIGVLLGTGLTKIIKGGDENIVDYIDSDMEFTTGGHEESMLTHLSKLADIIASKENSKLGELLHTMSDISKVPTQNIHDVEHVLDKLADLPISELGDDKQHAVNILETLHDLAKNVGSKSVDISEKISKLMSKVSAST